MELIHKGKVKSVFDNHDGTVTVEFRDDITAGDGAKHDLLEGKGALSNAINDIFFQKLKEAHVSNHYLGKVSERAFKAFKLQIFPLEVVVRNFTAGSFCKRYGLDKGSKLEFPIVEFFLKNDKLHDPLICPRTILALKISTAEELKKMEELALGVNEALVPFLRERGLILADFKIEIGKDKDRLMVADEITPDSCRFWDLQAGDSLDKDIYRQSAGDALAAYREVLRRISA
ncbi:MAG: phosphoribosylaminoimidazolesuccinocarboxamide synthase [Coprothermobacterota bacterium]|nr:phosphoribosylaminoimidazolesuccinocarboxamide synthase [Coprothermobacterota bacterium]